MPIGSYVRRSSSIQQSRRQIDWMSANRPNSGLTGRPAYELGLIARVKLKGDLGASGPVDLHSQTVVSGRERKGRPRAAVEAPDFHIVNQNPVGTTTIGP